MGTSRTTGKPLIKRVPEFQGRGWLVGWANVCKYIGRAMFTARRYHKLYGMPLHRLPGDIPVAIPAELDMWIVEFSNRQKNSEGLKKLKEYRNVLLNKARDIQDGVSQEPEETLDSKELAEFKEMFE